jgi:hypothetical protein
MVSQKSRVWKADGVIPGIETLSSRFFNQPPLTKCLFLVRTETRILFRYEKQVRKHLVHHFGELDLSPGGRDEIYELAKLYFDGDEYKENIHVIGSCREWSPGSHRSNDSELLQTIQEERERGKTDPEIIKDALLKDRDFGYSIKTLVEKDVKYKNDVDNANLEHLMIMSKKRRLEENQNLVLRKWQMEIEKIFYHSPEDRFLYIVCDKVGNTGKTKLAQYLTLKYENEVLTFSPSNVENLLHLTASKYSGVFGPRLILCDVPRTHGLTRELIGTCELLKAGHFYSGKYSGRLISWERSPHLVLLTNQSAIELKQILKEMVSHDRIRLGIITGETLEWFRLSYESKSDRGQWIQCTLHHPPLTSVSSPSQDDGDHKLSTSEFSEC